MTALMMEPWLLTPAMHNTLCEIVMAHMTNADAQHVKAASFGKKSAPREYGMVGDGVAVIPVDGVIGRKFSSSLYSSGVTSVDVLARLLRDSGDDPQVKSVLMLMDSPGGSVQGVPEAGYAVKALTEKKPVIAYADGLMCSAAYWIASQANAIYSWNESTIGSIGVYSAHLDTSRKAENEGAVVEMFKSGKFKGMGYPGTSLTDEERAMIQKRVDEIGVQFRSTVRAGRDPRQISDDTMQGQSFTAAESIQNGLIDGICSMGDVVLECELAAKLRG
jgi:signal peptide peptidase SppA